MPSLSFSTIHEGWILRSTETSIWTLPGVSLKDGGDYECFIVSNNGNHSAKTYLEIRG